MTYGRRTFGALIVLHSITSGINFCDSDNRNEGNHFDRTHMDATYLFTSNIFDEHSPAISGCNGTTTCIRKCCQENYVLIHKMCILRESRRFEIPVYEINYVIDKHLLETKIVPGMIKCENDKYYRMDADVYPDDTFFIQKDGRLWQSETNKLLSYNQFCLENFEDTGVSALICFPKEVHALKLSRGINVSGMIISMPFLLATFFVYAILPDRNLHGKSLMCYVISLFGAYLILVFIQLYPEDLSDFNCKTLGIFCLFFFMVSFFWMNVMSIDIWWAFSGLRGFSGSKKEAERKRFLLYCGYAWGMPLLHILIVTSLTLCDTLPRNAWYNPGVGDGQCWFREGVPTLLYFYGPMALLILGNITLFCITAWKIKQVQQDTAMLRKDESKKHSYENDKQRFNLYLKLMLAMGVNWSMEIISWVVNWQVGRVPPYVWYLTDFCNALYGVFIFFIFVFKRNIWKLLKRRYYMIMGKPHLARSMTQTAYSPRTTGSTLSQTVTTEKSFVNDSSVLTSEVA